MFNKKLFINLSTAIVLATAAFCVYHYYMSSYRKTNYDASPIEAQSFYAEFRSNQAAAIAKYNNQPIKIKGVVADRNKSEGAVVINLETGNQSEGVECELDASFPHEKINFEAGEEVIFKGICIGTLDSNLRIVNCVVVP